jgi:hypothetical protein
MLAAGRIQCSGNQFPRALAVKAEEALQGLLESVVVVGRRSVSDEWGPFLVDPLHHRWATPLVSGVVDESLWYGVAKHDQALQHHGQIDIRDGPIAEEVVGAALEQGQGR